MSKLLETLPLTWKLDIYYINRTNVAIHFTNFQFDPFFSSPLPFFARKNIISKHRLEIEVSSLNILRLFYRFK